MDCVQLSSKCPRSSPNLDDDKLDYISNLPDDILLHILDKLPIDEAVDTSLLSKRWKDLWRRKRRIEAGYQWVQRTGQRALHSLLKLLSAHRENKIELISVSLQYNLSMLTEVVSLITYASLKNVEELCIDFNDKNDYRYRRRGRYLLVRIPESEPLACRSLVKLSLRYLQLETLPSRFKGLKQLFLEEVMLNEDSVGKIAGNCPSLTLLCLTNCNPTSDLKIIILAERNLLHLVIKEESTVVGNRSKLFIRVLGLKSIEFLSALPREGYHVEGILACSASATFRLDQMHKRYQAMRVRSFGLLGHYAYNFIRLLMRLTNVKVLTLSSWCIQVLSIEFMMLKGPPLFEATCLVLETGLKRWEMAGIGYMILSCCKLESVVIVMSAPAEINFRYYGRCKHLQNNLQNLAVVEFRNYSGDYAWEGDSFCERSFFAGYEYGSLLLWNLKTYAKNLKKFVFTTRKQVYESHDVQSFGDRDSYEQFGYWKVPRIFKTLEDK